MAGGRVKGITIDIDGNTTGLTKALKEVNGQTAKTSAELRDVNKLLKLDPGNTELLAQKQKLLSNAVGSTSEKLKALKSAQAQVEAQFKSGEIGEEQYRSFQRELVATKAQLDRFEKGLSGVDDALKGNKNATSMAESGYSKASIKAAELSGDLTDIKTTGKEASSGLKDSSDAASNMADNVDKLTKVNVGEYLGGISEKAAEMGGSVLETGMGFSDAQSKMQSAMGMTASEAESTTDTVKTVFGTGMTDSVDEATDAVMTVKNAFQDLDKTQLDQLTTELVGISQHTNVDIKDATKAAAQAMKGFGLDGQESTDLVAKGLQMGLNYADDFTDTVNEYSPTFKDAGISADAMLSTLNAGMENGAFNTDKVADAVKEFQLRLTSGQLDEPMTKFGKATQDVFQQFKDGQATSAEVMAAVGSDLKNMPANEAKEAVQGLGTQFEDLGQGASAALLEATTKTTEFGGAAKEASDPTPSEKLKGALDKLKTSLSELVEGMTPIIDTVAGIADAFSKAPGPIQTVVGVIGAVMAILAVLMPVITGVGTLIAAFGTAFILPAIAIIGGIVAAITAVILVFQNWGAITDWFQGVWNTVIEWFKNVWNGIPEFFSGIWEGIKNIFQTTVEWIGSFLQSGFGQAILFIINPFAGLVNFFIQNWDQIKQIFTNVVTAIAQFLSDAFNKIKQVTSDLWNGTKDVISDVVNGIKTIVSNVFNTVKNFISDVWNGIKTITNNVWNGIKKVVSTAVNNLKTNISNVFNAIKSVISNIWNGIKSVTSNVWNGIKDVVGKVVNGVKNTVSNGFNAVKGAVSNIFNSVKNTVKGIWDGIWNTISGIVDKIKGAFNFNLKFLDIKIPHIPMPHFNISGSFDPLKGKIPSVGINWYAKGGIFNKPTLFAANGGFNGLGEAGPEAALPLNKKTLGGIGEGIAQAMGSNGLGDKFEININVMADVTPKTISQISEQVQVGMTRALNAKNRVIGG